MIITLAMWIHVVLNAIVCFSPTKNPIWGELRVLFVVIATVALWCCFIFLTGYTG